MTTYDKKRSIAALLLVCIVAAAANWHFDFVFPKYARFIVGLSVVAAVIYYIRFFPTRQDFEEHRRKQING
jgi:hypothetical protein